MPTVMVIKNKVPVLFVLSLALCGCGGGGRKPPQPPVPPAPVEVQVAITSTAVNAETGQGDLFRPTLGGTWTARNLGGAQVYLQVTDSGNTFVLPTVEAAPAGGGFSYALALADRVDAGQRSGSLVVRACRDVACAQPYEGASASLAYKLRVTAVPEWVTHQGNAAHDGYVPITLDPSRFAPAWSWTTPAPAPGVESIVTSAGLVHAFATQVVVLTSRAQYFLALDAASGIVQWRKDFSSIDERLRNSSTYIGPLSIAHGRLYHQAVYELGAFCQGAPPAVCFADNGSEVRSLAIADGLPLMNAHWRPFGTARTAPVPYGEFVYVQGKKSLRAYHRDGGVHWEVANDAYAAPAVDEARVYAVTSTSESLLSAGNLQLHDRATGALLASIAHPAVPGVSGGVAPVLGGRGNVIVHVACKQEARLSCQLASMDTATQAWTWTSTARYWSGVAVANGVVYARRDASPMVVDAIDEATGRLLWSRPLTTGTIISGSLPNMIATRNLLFVGTDVGTYAMELDTGRIAYELPRALTMAISADRMLYLGRLDKNGSGERIAGLVAVRLQ